MIFQGKMEMSAIIQESRLTEAGTNGFLGFGRTKNKYTFDILIPYPKKLSKIS